MGFFATVSLGTTSQPGREAPVGVSVGWRVAADLAVLDDLRVVGEVALEPFVFGQRLLQLFAQANRSRGRVGLHQHRRCCLLGNKPGDYAPAEVTVEVETAC